MFDNKQDLAEKIQQSRSSTSQNVSSVLAVMVDASAELSQGENFHRIQQVSQSSSPLPHLPAFTHMLDILLDQSDVTQTLVTTDKADISEGHVAEMLRLDPLSRVCLPRSRGQ